MTKKYLLFLDLDGVLVDFEKGVKDLTGALPSEMSPRRMWPQLARADSFYDKLPWMPDGHALWDFSRSFSPIILTGLPLGKWAEPQKRSWCARELGPEVEVITCLTKEKPARGRQRSDAPAGFRDSGGAWTPSSPEEAVPVIPILVDDRDRVREDWVAMGGIFIHHHSARESMAQLQDLLHPPS